jgi:hypothetical protein
MNGKHACTCLRRTLRRSLRRSLIPPSSARPLAKGGDEGIDRRHWRRELEGQRPHRALSGGMAGGIGVGESAHAYNEVFTSSLSCVTGGSAGIGADMNRLGQRVIQMVSGPTILTGFGERARVQRGVCLVPCYGPLGRHRRLHEPP